MTAPKCTSWLGHWFSARYSYGPAVIPEGGIPYSPAVDELGDILERIKSRSYVHDICIRCGHVVPPSPSHTGEGERE